MSKKLMTYVVLIVLLASLVACGSQDVAEEQVVATPETAVPTKSDTNNGETAGEDTPATETADLPRLPALSGGGGGYGGGGLGIESSAAVEAPIPVDGDGLLPYYIENRLENAVFTLNTELPSLPSSTTVWQQNTDELSLDMMQAIASQLGFAGPIYTDPWYDQMIQENPDGWVGPRAYHLFADSRHTQLLWLRFQLL